MSVTSRSFNTIPGAAILAHPFLVGAQLYGVKRQGLGFTKISPLVTPTGIEFNHLGSRIYFDPLTPFIAGEKIWVLYQ